jgi:hypothetical protein
MIIPKFVKLNNSALRLREEGDYYRDAGCWSVGWRIKDGILISDYSYDKEWLHEIPLIEITEQEYKDDNKGYL